MVISKNNVVGNLSIAVTYKALEIYMEWFSQFLQFRLYRTHQEALLFFVRPVNRAGFPGD
jgi:hypothetical protein